MISNETHINIKLYRAETATIRKAGKGSTVEYLIPKEEVKERILCENKEKMILQKVRGICKEKTLETKVGIFTESYAPRIFTIVVTKNSLSLKEW